MTKYGSPKERSLLKIVRKRRLCTLIESSMHKRKIWPRLQQQHMPLATFFAKSKGCFRTLPKLLNWRLSANYTLMTFFWCFTISCGPNQLVFGTGETIGLAKHIAFFSYMTRLPSKFQKMQVSAKGTQARIFPQLHISLCSF